MLDNYTRKAVITNVVDGDTVDALVDLGYSITTQQRFRLKGINATEMTGATKEQGLKAKVFLEGLILGKEVTITSSKTDSFGRYLATIYYQMLDVEMDINRFMITKGMAIPYER